MKCACRLAVCVVGAVVIAAAALGASYGFGAIAVSPKMATKKAIEIDTTVLSQPAATVAASSSTASSAAAPAAGPGPIEALLAKADSAAGEKYAKVCAACHSFKKGEPSKIGPNLYEIVGASHAHMAGFSYSASMKATADKNWTYDELNHFLYKPGAYIAGTKMAFAGIKNDNDRANVIAWLRTLADQPKALPAQ